MRFLGGTDRKTMNDAYSEAVGRIRYALEFVPVAMPNARDYSDKGEWAAAAKEWEGIRTLLGSAYQRAQKFQEEVCD